MTGYIIFAVVAFAATYFGVRYIMRNDILCQFCGGQCKVWAQVPKELKASLLGYFLSYEKRKPDKRGIFVCDKCKTVFDDFSGEKENHSIDAVTIGPPFNPKVIITCRTWCKVCNNLMLSCDPDNPDIHCRTCETKYEWKTHEKSGYRFLMPPPDAKIKRRCDDLSGIA